MPILQTVIIVILCALAFSVCDTLAAQWAVTGSRKALALSITLGPISYLTFAYLNTKINLALAGGLVNSLIVVFTLISGVFYMKQSSISHNQIFGLILISIGIYFSLKS